MYKDKDFDYDVWRNSEGKCFARIKCTGEVCEISHEVLKLLRREEKRLYREKTLLVTPEGEDFNKNLKASIRYPISFEVMGSNENFKFQNTYENLEDEQVARETESDFMKMLTEYQKEVFICIMKNGERQIDFAKRHLVTPQSVRNAIKKIREKGKKFFK